MQVIAGIVPRAFTWQDAKSNSSVVLLLMLLLVRLYVILDRFVVVGVWFALHLLQLAQKQREHRASK